MSSTPPVGVPSSRGCFDSAAHLTHGTLRVDFNEFLVGGRALQEVRDGQRKLHSTITLQKDTQLALLDAKKALLDERMRGDV